MRVWDGQRERSSRDVVSASHLQLQGLDFRFVSESVTSPTDWCFHQPNHVLVVHRRGNLRTMELEFQNGPTGRHLPRVGDVWVIPAEHRYAALAHGATVSFCEITLPTATFGGQQLAPRVGYQDTLLYGLVERLAGMAQHDGAAATLFRQSLAQTLLWHITDRYPARRSAASVEKHQKRHLDNRAQQTVIDYLNSELDDRIDLNELAAAVDMTTGNLLAAFSAAFATTPHQYLIELRIQRAKAMLSGSASSITEISSAVGFSTPSHFTTTFKQRVGVTPTVYRNRR